MRTWSWVWAVELISIHWNIFTYLMCVHWDYANCQVCLHIWGNSLLSLEWLGNLLVRLPEALMEPLLGWGANFGRSRLFSFGNVWDFFYHVFHTNNSQIKPHKVYCSHCISIFFLTKGSDFIIHVKPSQFSPCCIPGDDMTFEGWKEQLQRHVSKVGFLFKTDPNPWWKNYWKKLLKITGRLQKHRGFL